MATIVHLRSWWATLDREWQKLLLHAIDADYSDPDELQLYEILSLKTIFMDVPGDHGDPDDVEMFELKTLAPLRMLSNLESLTIQGHVSDVQSLDPVKDCIHLRYLSFHGTNITDLSPVRFLANLENLSFNRAAVTDISPLAGLVKLRSVNAIESAVSSLQPLSGKQNLKGINIWGDHLPQREIDDFAARNPGCEVNGMREALEAAAKQNQQNFYPEGYDFDDEMFQIDDDDYAAAEADERDRIFEMIEDGLNTQIAGQLGLGNVYNYRLIIEIEGQNYEVIFDYLNSKTQILRICCSEWEYNFTGDEG